MGRFINRFPPLFDGYTFGEIHQEYLSLVEDAEINLSRLCGKEEPDYLEKMKELEDLPREIIMQAEPEQDDSMI